MISKFFQSPFLDNKIFLVENHIWIDLIILVIFCFIIEIIGRRIIERIIKIIFLKKIKFTKKELHHFSRPIGVLLFSLTWLFLLKFFNFGDRVKLLSNRFGEILISISIIWFSHILVNLIGHYFIQKAKQSASKVDDILIPLLRKTGLILVYILGTAQILHLMTVDVKGIIAGLGIGGLALAFAAKDTLANFFGSIMLVLDRPFDIGDFIVAGNIEGVVEDVGFRSTRIRTFYDSILTIANGQLISMPIDNRGKRRYRRFQTNLGLQYDTSPEKIEAFCEGIRQLILNHKWTRKDYFNVYFSEFSASSLDIRLQVYWETDDYTREMNEKHRLLIDILRLAKDLNVEFAFPTQTLHVFNEENKVKNQDQFNNVKGQQILIEGEKLATKLIKDPISPKTPRSKDISLETKEIGL